MNSNRTMSIGERFAQEIDAGAGSDVFGQRALGRPMERDQATAMLLQGMGKTGGAGGAADLEGFFSRASGSGGHSLDGLD